MFDFINNIKKTNNLRELQVFVKIMFKSSNNVDEERELYLKSTNIIANFSASAKQLIEILCDSLFKTY